VYRAESLVDFCFARGAGFIELCCGRLPLPTSSRNISGARPMGSLGRIAK
jgi:hypothetical protein